MTTRQIDGIVNHMTITQVSQNLELRYSHEDFGARRLWRIEAVRLSGAHEVLALATGYDDGDSWRVCLVSGGNLAATVPNRVLAEQWLMLLGRLMTAAQLGPNGYGGPYEGASPYGKA